MAVSFNTGTPSSEDIDEVSDEEFDALLATVPLPGLPTNPTPSEYQPQLSSNKRKTNDPEEEVESPRKRILYYEPIGFGEIGKYMRNKRKKLLAQDEAIRESDTQSSPRPQIFSGLVIHVNGYTSPPSSEIRNMIVLHGGTFMAFLDSKTAITNIIATSLTPKKRHEFRNYRVTNPDWIVKSVAAGRLLNWADFSLLTEQSSAHDLIVRGERTGGLAINQRKILDLIATRSPSTFHRVSKPEANLKSPLTTTLSTDLSKLHNHSRPIKKLPSNADDPESIQDQQEGSSRLDFKRACLDPNYVRDYFQQSRLHHLSTWKTELLQKFSILSETKTSTASINNQKRLNQNKREDFGRVIMHVDFDCFFISAGLINRPGLRGKPVAVCHSKSNCFGNQPSTSEIASCSYEARAFGVKNGQMLGKARELCPELQTMPYEFELYEEISTKFYNLLLSYADELQPVSVDECLIDVSSRFSTLNLAEQSAYDAVTRFAEEIRTLIREQTNCEASIGVSHNILLSKLATKQAKPAGSSYLSESSFQEVLESLKLDDLPGVGWAQRQEIEKQLQVQSVGELRNVPLQRLVEIMGPVRGKTLYQYSRGIDDRPLKSSNYDRKSVSAVVNYGIRFDPDFNGGNDQARAFVLQLGLEVGRRLDDLSVLGRHLTVKIMKRAPGAPVETKKFLGHGICEDVSKSILLSLGVKEGGVIGEEAWKLISSMRIPPEDLRGIGIQIQRLEKSEKGVERKKFQAQSTIAFKATKPSESLISKHQLSRTTSLNSSRPLRKSNQSSKQSDHQKIAYTPKKLESMKSTQIFIPSPSQIDFEAVNALPMSLKTKVLDSFPRASKSATNNDTTPERSLPQHDTKELVKTNGKTKSANTVDPSHFLPSGSQVDWKILDELPSSVRKPLEAFYARYRRPVSRAPPLPQLDFGKKFNSSISDRVKVKKVKGDVKSRGSRVREGPGNFAIFLKGSGGRTSTADHRVKPTGSSQRLISKKSFKLISKTSVKKKRGSPDVREGSENVKEIDSSKGEVFEEMLPTPNRITDQQLEALQIDVKFFRELGSARAFQLDLIYDQFQLHSEKFRAVTTKTDVWKAWRENYGKPSKVLTIEIPKRPTIPVIPFKRRVDNGRGQLKGRFSEVEEAIKFIEDWMESYEDEEEIEEEEIETVEIFLLDCIDKRRGSGQDLEKVYKVIVWWQDFIAQKNKKSIGFREDVFFYDNQEVGVGLERWKGVLEKIKARVNEVCERDHGAGIF
ncbi:DNA polymerase IV 3 [Phakopsora pachyrhizi]|uniref:DNA repair protein REV1 n=1 Tax=Phakopsora pachyrhizi TaxID=170000 RepID=A0AAV0BHA8_PHAPC|nr:DNA polymerase IV 3 [Phakopsora pachyrhizi]CAH7685775.1 DNA polymerase IV 3 [Phakopsora pachyrhizi]